MKKMVNIPCIFLGGHLHGQEGEWNTNLPARCVMLQDIDASEPLLPDGRVHMTVQCQVYRPLVPPQFEDPPMGSPNQLPLLVVVLQQVIDTCNHVLH